MDWVSDGDDCVGDGGVGSMVYRVYNQELNVRFGIYYFNCGCTLSCFIRTLRLLFLRD